MHEMPRKLVILAEGTLDFHHGKTATSILRYRAEDVVAVIDRQHAGFTTEAVLGLGGSIPIVANVEVALTLQPTALLIGIAPRGGTLPPEWRQQILQAINAGLDIVSGLHFMLADDPEFSEAARHRGVRLIDVRQPPEGIEVANFVTHGPHVRVVTFVGSDCAVGKMTAALEVVDAARNIGLSAAFVATGQTGIMLQGNGISIDRVIGDFMAGAAEQLVHEAAATADWIFVEGQGSLLHPAYSGVTLALLHGSAPDGLILVHQTGHDQIDEYPVRIPSVKRLVQIYEDAASWVKPAPVLGIALNTRGLNERETSRAIDSVQEETGLPVTDPVKFGGAVLVRAVMEALATWKGGHRVRSDSIDGTDALRGLSK